MQVVEASVAQEVGAVLVTYTQVVIRPAVRLTGSPVPGDRHQHTSQRSLCEQTCVKHDQVQDLGQYTTYNCYCT